LVTPAAEAYVTQLLGGHLQNACLVPNGIDTVRFHPADSHERVAARSSLGLPPDKPVVLFVGRLVEKKGIDLVIEVSRRLPDTQFLIVGDGPLAGMVPGDTGVTWHRSLPPERMPECYQAADCFLLPSHGEGLPLAVQEAAACGLPIVVSEGEIYAGPLVRQGVCAAVPRSASVIADQVKRILAGEMAGLGSQGRCHAEAQWSASSMAASYIDLLEEAVTGRQGEKRR
jgi:glycosyltransferase involved in cell wall biosynthesis